MNGVTNEKMCINTNRQTETHPERDRETEADRQRDVSQSDEHE